MNQYNEIWKINYDLNQKRTGYTSSAEHFSKSENAEKMLKTLLDGRMNRAKDQISCLNFEAGSSVIDIGAGPGTLAVPLAKKGCHVTVVEPSPAMARCMEEYKQSLDVTADIAIIPKIIEDIIPDEIGTYDYVISSFALAVRDVRDALLKMNSLAKRQVHIFWFMNNPSWAQIEIDLFGKIHDGEEIKRSYADLVWQVLYQEGIYANLCVYPMKDRREFSTFEEALDEYSKNLSVSNDKQKKIVEDYLNEHLICHSNGRYALLDNGKYAHIWWNKDERGEKPGLPHIHR